MYGSCDQARSIATADPAVNAQMRALSLSYKVATLRLSPPAEWQSGDEVLAREKRRRGVCNQPRRPTYRTTDPDSRSSRPTSFPAQ